MRGEQEPVVGRGDRTGRRIVAALLSHQPGQDVVEYGIIIATIALVVLIGTVAFGNQISPWFQTLAGRITTVGT